MPLCAGYMCCSFQRQAQALTHNSKLYLTQGTNTTLKQWATKMKYDKLAPIWQEYFSQLQLSEFFVPVLSIRWNSARQTDKHTITIWLGLCDQYILKFLYSSTGEGPMPRPRSQGDRGPFPLNVNVSQSGLVLLRIQSSQYLCDTEHDASSSKRRGATFSFLTLLVRK